MIALDIACWKFTNFLNRVLMILMERALLGGERPFLFRVDTVIILISIFLYWNIPHFRFGIDYANQWIRWFHFRAKSSGVVLWLPE